MKKKFKMEELDCANCAAKMEALIKKIPVVVDANMNFMGQISSTSTEGTWTQSGNIITVKGASVEGAGLSDDGKMELRDNNKLYIVPPEDASVSNTAEFEYMYFEKQ